MPVQMGDYVYLNPVPEVPENASPLSMQGPPTPLPQVHQVRYLIKLTNTKVL